MEFSKISATSDYIRGQKGGQKAPLEIQIPIKTKIRESIYKLKVYSYVKFSEEDNGSGPESLSAP